MFAKRTATTPAPKATIELTAEQMDTVQGGASITAGAIYSLLTVASAGLTVAIGLIKAV
jgi:hypothetical protein